MPHVKRAWLVGGELFALWAGLLSPTLCLADMVEVEASRDTTLYEEEPETLANGEGDYLFSGRTNGDVVRRSPLAFDLTSRVPVGSTVTGVFLDLTMSRTQIGDSVVTLHRILEPWGEGSSDASGREGRGGMATPGDATWTYAFYDTVPWTIPGGTYVEEPSAVATLGLLSGRYSFSDPVMVTDVQGWLDDPSSNHGFILVGDEKSGDRSSKRYDSRHVDSFRRRPRLRVTFDPPANAGACCEPDGGCGVVLHPGTACAGTYRGIGAVCDPNPCPEPPGACCIADAAATCTLERELDCVALGGDFRGPSRTCEEARCPVVLTPFVDPLPVPRVAEPRATTPEGGVAYSIDVREVTATLHRDLPPTRLWAYDDGGGASFPGPTLEARTGTPTTVIWGNDLRDEGGELRTEHLLPVDSCPHGASVNDPRTVVHLHGGHIPAEVDGYPESTQLPGELVVYEYPNIQPAAALWYHDHALGITRLNVYLGLAGYYIIRDEFEDALGLPSGEFERPLMVADRSFRSDGSFDYPAAWQEHFGGDTNLVNGKVWPYLEVKQGKYRFRVLNASNGRTYTLQLSNGESFVQIGTDGGLLPAPVPLTEVTLGPAERADLVVDFAGYPAGTEIVLTNSAPFPFPNADGAGVVPEVMKFIVLGEPGFTAPLPTELRGVPPIPEDESVITRDFELARSPHSCTGTAWRINGREWDDIDERPMLGTTEIWRFVNRSGLTHPMHMHLVFFQVLDRQPFEFMFGTPVPTGPAVPPAAHEAGWKDTVQVGPLEMVRVIAHFEDFVGRFPYHCHILEHEDHDMMRQFETVTICGDGAVGMPVEECDDGESNSDTEPDACRSDCRSPYCGDGVVDSEELCDPPSSCPVRCDDGDPCTVDRLEGDPEACGSVCLFEAVPGCADGSVRADGGVIAPSFTPGGGGCGCDVTERKVWTDLSWCMGGALLLLAGRRRARARRR